LIKVELFDNLDDVERDAAGALDRERQPVLFDRLSWYRLLERHCPPPGQLLVARAEDEQGGRSWLFLLVHQRRAAAYANWYTLRYNGVFALEGGSGRQLDKAIAGALRRRGLVSIDLHPLRGPEIYRTVFGLSGWRAFEHATTANWVADVAGLSFDEYWRRRPAKLRNTAQRKAKSSDLECSIYNSFDAEAWSKYEEVYRESWKPQEGSPAFLQALAEQEGSAGTLRLGIARSGKRPVAAQFWLVENGRATIHKLAYREDAKQLSPGTVLSMAMFRHVIDIDRVDLIDFGLGDEPYKADWMDRKVPVGRIVAYNKGSLAGWIGAARQAASALVRSPRNN
jgi:CelD/BcsL family acetyltransferase involved in cellulose biosynthesis